MILSNTAEGGGSAGSIVTVTNSANSGDPFSLITGNVVYANTPPGRAGQRSIRADGATSYISWTGFSSSQTAFRGYFYLTTLPTSSGLLIVLGRADSTGTRVGVNTSGRLIHQTQGGGTTTAPASGSIPVNTWMRIEVQAKAGTGTTDGTQRVQLFNGENTTPIYSFAADGNINASGGQAFSVCRVGRFSGSFTNGALLWDDVAVSDTFAPIGPVAVSNAGWHLWDGASEAALPEPAGVWNGTALVPVTYTIA